MNNAAFDVRPASPSDQQAIRTLVHSEWLNPNDLDWRRFVVATDANDVVGAVQLRRHADGSRELGSLVVRKEARGCGLAAKLIDRLLASITARVFMITGAAFASHYRRWGFGPIPPVLAPSSVRRNYDIGRLVGVFAFLLGRRRKHLVILGRHAWR